MSDEPQFHLGCSLHACPCGFLGDHQQDCTCSTSDIKRYRKRISGPLLDRIDIYVHVSRLDYSEMTNTIPSESSAIISQRVAMAREIQYARLSKYNIFCNAHMGHKHIKSACRMTNGAQTILEQAFSKMNLSARGYDRILKVARTIADLAQAEELTELHIAEAVHFRNNMQENY
ncbi:ATP-binding protein [Pelosinus sp. sgz500959]|uniref:magnesium chelatase subunit ChlI family protein n=1 Tax=Pelosinus sp. sgz500959 TaxID=3242472 RepID=UPI003671D855